MPAAYREPSAPSPGEAPPDELVYRPDTREPSTLAGSMFLLFTLPAVVGAAVSVVLTPTAGLVALVASAGGAVWLRRRRLGQAGAVLRVRRGSLLVLDGRGGTVRAELPLADLRDVALETKTIQRVTDGHSAIPAMRFADSRVGPEIDTARIVLVGTSGRLELTDAFGPHMDATEWLGRIRVFLRKHGWVPADEKVVEDDGDT